jgi:hypothetical protein
VFLIFELRPLARRLRDSPGRDVENGKDGRVGKAPRITFAAIDLPDNVQGELSPHVIASFVVNGSAFLAFSIMAERRGLVTTRQGQKSISTIWQA